MSSVLSVGKQDLDLKLGVVRLVSEYIDVVMWFLSVGLLPEHPGLAYFFALCNWQFLLCDVYVI